MYKCHVCGRQFQGGDRRDPQTIFDEYLHGKQTYAQLAERYRCSPKTIQRCIDKAKPRMPQKGQSVANVVMDTTYFSDIGVMVFKNSLDGKILYVKIVGSETVRGYVDGVDRIKEWGTACKPSSLTGGEAYSTLSRTFLSSCANSIR